MSEPATAIPQEAIRSEFESVLSDAYAWRTLRRLLSQQPIPSDVIQPEQIADIIIDAVVRQDLIKAMLESAVRLDTLAGELAASLCLIPDVVPAPPAPLIGQLAPLPIEIDTIVTPPLLMSDPSAMAEPSESPTPAKTRRNHSRLAGLRDTTRIRTLEGHSPSFIAGECGAGVSTIYNIIADLRRCGELPETERGAKATFRGGKQGNGHDA